MTNLKNQKRVLALDVRPLSFGYVVFEGPEQLLDWGVRSFRSGRNAVQVPWSKKFASLLEEFIPSVVVVKEPSARSKRRKFLSAIRAKAKSRGISVLLLSPRAVKNAFGGQDRLTKYQIASAIAQRFPELAWRLPPKRKPWQSEDYRMSIFDAAALGVAYFARQVRQAPEASASDPAPP